VPDGEDLWGLLLVISLNKVRTQDVFHNAAKRDVRHTIRLHAASDLPAQHEASEQVLQMLVEEALEELNPRLRQLVELRLQGHELAEIAIKVGRSKRTVERQLREIRTKLSGLLPEAPSEN
jgi:RNA polymerase sigma-70 factor (ECF subfamily)